MKKLSTTLLLLFCIVSYSQNMNNSALDKLITKAADSIIHTNGKGYWQFVKNDRLLVCITDSIANRMRVISPITEASNLDKEQLTLAMMANYHTALDVKYAIAEGLVWSVFIHPLKELSDDQLTDAILQVYKANKNFGTTYQSTDLFFAPQLTQPEIEQKKDSIKTIGKKVQRI